MSSIRGFKYPFLFYTWILFAWILSACTAAPAEGERIVNGLQQLQSKRYDDEGSMYHRVLHKRADGTVSDYCRYWAQSSTLIGDKLYMSGGIATFKEDFRNNTIHLYLSAIIVDLSGGIQFPVKESNSLVQVISMGDSGEATQQGAFWWDGNDYIYKYGGWFADHNTWWLTPQAIVAPSDIWRFQVSTLEWESKPISPSAIRRSWGGAVTSVPDKKIGYFLGGIVDNRTDTEFSAAPGYLLLQDSFLNFDSGLNSFDNMTATDLGHIALGNLVYIEEMGKDGILVYLGGAEGPSGWVPTDTIDGMTLRDLGTVWVYDIRNTRWYSQKTSGDTPKGRISACAVVVSSEDKTSWNIFLHGGGSLGDTGVVYGDTWVLSLPSFQWKVVDQKGDKKFEHTCHVIKGNQLLVIGGRDKLQDYAGDPASNYSVDASRWSCLKQGIFSSLNLNTFEWEDSIPMNDAPYKVHSLISALIGGGATGGANTLAPLSGWDDAGLGDIMITPNATTSPTPSPGPTSPTGSTSASSSSTKDKPLGAIIGGVVGGVVLIAVIAFAIILLRKRKPQEDPVTTAEPAPPVAQTPQFIPQTPQQPPGYIWDPQTKQYYIPSYPPPFPDSNNYSYPQEPVEVPATEPHYELPGQILR